MTNVQQIPLRPSELPDWARSFLDEALDNEVAVVNAHVVESGPLKDAVLVNTTEGSALLARRRFGHPALVRLPLPGRRFSFTCVDCQERMELLDADTPRPFHCSRCARAYALSREGDTYVLFTAMDGAAPTRRDGPGWTRIDPTTDRPRTEASRDATRRATKKPTPVQRRKPREKPQAFRYNGYTLHTRQVDLKSGRTQRIYFFSKKRPAKARPAVKPKGFEVKVTNTGLPVLRRSRNGEQATPSRSRKRTKKHEPPCAARTEGGKPCQNTSRANSKYCAAHAGYRPRRAPPAKPAKRAKKTKRYEPQCQGLTETGKQCRNSARAGSKYCMSHFGYRPPRAAATRKRGADTKPRVKGAEDTLPSHRHMKRKPGTKRRAVRTAPPGATR